MNNTKALAMTTLFVGLFAFSSLAMASGLDLTDSQFLFSQDQIGQVDQVAATTLSDQEMQTTQGEGVN